MRWSKILSDFLVSSFCSSSEDKSISVMRTESSPSLLELSLPLFFNYVLNSFFFLRSLLLTERWLLPSCWLFNGVMCVSSPISNRLLLAHHLFLRDLASIFFSMTSLFAFFFKWSIFPIVSSRTEVRLMWPRSVYNWKSLIRSYIGVSLTDVLEEPKSNEFLCCLNPLMVNPCDWGLFNVSVGLSIPSNASVDPNCWCLDF